MRVGASGCEDRVEHIKDVYIRPWLLENIRLPRKGLNLQVTWEKIKITRPRDEDFKVGPSRSKLQL